jgi:hypothetical protein
MIDAKPNIHQPCLPYSAVCCAFPFSPSNFGYIPSPLPDVFIIIVIIHSSEPIWAQLCRRQREERLVGSALDAVLYSTVLARAGPKVSITRSRDEGAFGVGYPRWLNVSSCLIHVKKAFEFALLYLRRVSLESDTDSISA